ncbi:uncharacterized protein METZ01_LOCUS124299 [marine metagenome]|uniref:Uncharacterized protein n=1 Tax=marine metagenome TaxID=408172 RepID=A0A381Y3E0_9ZZZZ
MFIDFLTETVNASIVGDRLKVLGKEY